MAVIALASPKGGCGKSTTAIVLAGEFADQGYRVRIIDADPKARVGRWAAVGETGPNISVVTATAHTLVSTLRQAEQDAEIVLIDVEGSANMTLPMAIGHAHFVVIPANPSAADVEDAVETVQLVNDTPNRSGRVTPHALLWSRVPVGFRSREFKALEKQVQDAGISIVGELSELIVYKSLFSFSTTLDRLPSSEVSRIDKARAEGKALADAIGAAIVNDQEKGNQEKAA